MKIILTLSTMCVIFYACKKSNTDIQYTYPTVSYTLHTNFENQVYDHSHSSKFEREMDYPFGFISWDNGTAVGSSYACRAEYLGTFYKFHLYDSAVGDSVDTRSILIFTLPSTSINSFTDHNDTSVLINIRDTTYSGHAIVSVTIAGQEGNLNATPSFTTNGSFSMSGIVSNGYSSDSVSFSSTGTFTNMPFQ